MERYGDYVLYSAAMEEIESLRAQLKEKDAELQGLRGKLKRAEKNAKRYLFLKEYDKKNGTCFVANTLYTFYDKFIDEALTNHAKRTKGEE